MRYFYETYFDGAGNKHDNSLSDPARSTAYRATMKDTEFSYSYMMRRMLILRLKQGLSHLSGLQQWNPWRSDAANEKEAKAFVLHNLRENERCQAEIEDIARDIVAALTGKEILFVDPATRIKPSPKPGNLCMIADVYANESHHSYNPEKIMELIRKLEIHDR